MLIATITLLQSNVYLCIMLLPPSHYCHHKCIWFVLFPPSHNCHHTCSCKMLLPPYIYLSICVTSTITLFPTTSICTVVLPSNYFHFICISIVLLPSSHYCHYISIYTICYCHHNIIDILLFMHCVIATIILLPSYLNW